MNRADAFELQLKPGFKICVVCGDEKPECEFRLNATFRRLQSGEKVLYSYRRNTCTECEQRRLNIAYEKKKKNMSRKTQPKIRTLGAASTPGQYGFDNGCIAFGDPLEAIGKKAKTREQARSRWKEQGAKKQVNRSSKSDFHRKHG